MTEPAIKAVQKAVGYALVLNDQQSYEDLGLVLMRLTREQRACLAWSCLITFECSRDDIYAIADSVLYQGEEDEHNDRTKTQTG